MAFAAPATTTISVAQAATYIATLVTGEEHAMPPRDRREYVPYLAPAADRYIYIVNKLEPRRTAAAASYLDVLNRHRRS
jgi:hypothetical protein